MIACLVLSACLLGCEAAFAAPEAPSSGSQSQRAYPGYMGGNGAYPGNNYNRVNYNPLAYPRSYPTGYSPGYPGYVPYAPGVLNPPPPQSSWFSMLMAFLRELFDPFHLFSGPTSRF
uniref:Telomerase-binding protein EST1A n=1 Tax=Lygus hesperus TaxID=30085 RepID=A0A0A9YED4_LYGHE